MKVGILGGGESAMGAALLARKHEYEIFLSDAGEISENIRAELNSNKVPFEEKGHTIDRLDQMDVIVKSPGIPTDASVIKALARRGHHVISEIEWAYRNCNGRILGITGSNGKTTTAMLCHHLLSHAGKDVALCGNVGISFARVLSESEHDWFVVEISSFQLDDIETFRPDIGILLNITPDHLNRYHGDLNAYAAAKMRIGENMRSDDLLIYNAEDKLILEMLEKGNDKGGLHGVTAVQGTEFGLPSEALPGSHNAFNGVCAIAAMRHIGIVDEVILEGLRSFERPPHRMEEVATIGGVRYLNDSKATNVDSVFYALEAMHGPVIWIAGGQDKGNDYAQLIDLVERKLKMLICLGIDNKNLLQAFSYKVSYMEETTNMFEAVSMADSNASSGDTVLLSPACASFDLFNNYEHRGNEFKNAVNQLRITN
jgi:UDP-N-acetylmuramoylalanine--D-glutamate ligase